MKKILLLLAFFTGTHSLYAQQSDTTWKFGGAAGINLSQVSLSNWAAGGDGSIAFDVNFNYGVDYTYGPHLWTNRLELAYGLNDTETNGTRKTNDKIYLSSTYGYKIAPKWYVSAFMIFNTQFDRGYNYAVSGRDYISKFMAPGYLSAGLGFTWIPNGWFNATFSPAAWRGTFVLDDKLSDEGAYGVDPGKKLFNEFGVNVLAEAKFDLMRNVEFYSRLNLYSNYLKNPQNVNVQWDIQIKMKVNRWISANLSLNMIYDDDVKIKREDGTMKGAELQLKEVLGIGLQAAF